MLRFVKGSLRQLSCSWIWLRLWRESGSYKICFARFLQGIVKATQQKDYNAVKRLQYLLTHSFYAKALAVKRVVTNDGRKTPGVDGVLWNTPAKKMKAVLSLTDKGYRARPLRRVYIEKKDKKKKRPLGIPTMYDRAMQALYALALEPVAETTADGKSFGFRKGRCAQDACEYLFNALSRKHISPKWVLEGDIKGCFDHISHDWLLANIPMDKNILKQFLKAGFIYQRELFPTEEGTPQGGIISPILANMTLDGIEKKLVERFHTNALGKVDSRFKNAHKVNFVRYADDFVVTAATPELALEAKELIREFLAERGLELSDEKTVVTNIDDGFDFLGWNFRKYNEKLIIKPSKKAVKAIVSNISDTILRRGKAWQQDVLIMKLNEQIRGWTNYHQSVCASDAFAHLDYVLYELLWRWAKRRHPKKNKWWISMRYWHRVGNRNWVFSTENKELIRVDSTAIVRHTKIKATANPFLDEAYVFRYTTLRGEHRSVYAKELSELRKKEVKIRRAIEDGLDPDRAERITLNELFDEYISQKYDLKQSTMTNYKYMYNHYVRDGFGKLRISKIKYSDIKKFYYSLILEKGFKPNSMEIVHTLLHPTFTMAVRDGLLRLNPTEGVMAEIKKSHCWEKTKRHALTVAEQRAFTNYIANSEEYRGWFPLFTVMLGTGCRIGEVLGLRWQDVDFKNRTISINHNLVYRVQEDGTCTNHVNSPKTKAGIRIIPMIDEVFDAFLEEYQYQKVIGFCTDEIDGYSGFVFCTGDGKVYLPNAINRTIRSICADYNKEEESKAKEENRDPVFLPKFSCHILRHTFCTRFCENETNLKVIQEIMGHADISTTMDVYAEATQEKKKESMTSLQSALLVR